MKKTFKITVLDELYVNSTLANNTLTLAYNGPAEISAKVIGDSVFVVTSEEDVGDRITINANTDTAAAYLLTTPKDATSYEFEEEILPDGTVYMKIVNPQLHDYYEVTAVTETDEETNETSITGVQLSPIVKDPRTPGLIKAEVLLSRVDSRLNTPVESDTEQTTADLLSFKEVLEDFIAQELPKKVWKYIDFEPAPTVPESLTPILGA